ncbi:hypothetical protein [Psychrobacillus soli]|uniref:Uncharacterized protein n=1 Tax=Psychrobacillus soli TaxID=1543965 RepID=A0A544TKL1_9BACI|nr:hypothetical protein [Psychrobacillus soli]TQR17973.1 hypothetical protein FG383_03750 [Psychrobacillus soli]
MNKTKKRKIGLLFGTFLFLITITVLLFTSAPKAVLEICSPFFQQGTMETQILQLTLMEKGALYDQVGERLKEKGYEHRILGGINAEDRILVKFVLANKEANNIRQQEIAAIFNDYIIKNNLDPLLFQVKVSNDTSTNW